MKAAVAAAGKSRPPPFKASISARVFALMGLAYVVYASSRLGFTWQRFVIGLGEGARLLSGLFPPDFHRWQLLLQGVIESVQIAVIATVFGVLLALPLGFLAARNLMPTWVSATTRLLIALCRSFHPVRFIRQTA